MRFQITHWHMLAPHDQVVVEVEAVDAAAANEQAQNLVGFGRTYAIAVLPEPEPEPEPERLIALDPEMEFPTEFAPDDPMSEIHARARLAEQPAKPKRHRRLKREDA